MQGFMISLSAQTASFREPGSKLYHHCLPLPPFTTLVGLAGAALGLSFNKAINRFKDKGIWIGVKGISKGTGRDLWNYAKISNKKEVNKDIVAREFLYCLDIQVFYACNDVSCIKELRAAFQDPVYVLTLGNSDELVLCKEISSCQEVHSTMVTELSNCWMPGNISDNYVLDWEKIREADLTIKLTTPQVVSLPVDFNFKGLLRRATRYQMFSFIPDYMKLKEKVEVYMFNKETVPMFSLTK